METGAWSEVARKKIDSKMLMLVFTGGILFSMAATILAAVIPTGYSLALYLRKQDSGE